MIPFRRVIIKPEELKPIIQRTLDSSFVGGLLIVLSQVLYWNQIHYKEYLYKVCKEVYTMVPVTIFFPKNSYLVESFNDQLLVYESSGLIQHWAAAHMDKKFLNFEETSSGPQKLTLDHLAGTIQMLVGGLILSFVVFLGEICWMKLREVKFIRRLFRY